MPKVGSFGEFDITKPEEWSIYAERLNFYLEANAITDASLKRATLLSECGAPTFSIVKSLVAPQGISSKSYDEIVQVLKNHFSPKPAEIYERFKFQKRMQGAQEGVSAHVAALRSLAQTCNFGNTLETRLDRKSVV